VDLFAFLQAPEDYALHFFQSSVFRLLRNLSAFLALILPAFYVAITTFHQEMIPTKLAMSIIESKKTVPFPTVIEVLLMLLAFEILLEAGLRLPKSIGQTVSIIGALVVGDAAITAKILSPGVVIVIATAGITGFVIPSQDLANTVRILRLLLVFCSLFGGLFGIGVGIIAILYHLCTLEFFGVPYLSPFVAGEGRRMFHDTVVRASWLKQKIRPRSVRPEDSVRQG
jgi:spore germination protein KA